MRANPWLLLAAIAAAVASPARGEEPLERVVLRWQPVPGAAGYDLQISSDPSFTRRELEVRAELAGYRLAASDERRYWRVRAVDADGRPGQWSAAKTIEPRARGAAPAPATAPTPEPEPRPLDVPPLPPAPLEEATPREADAASPRAIELAGGAEADRPPDLRDGAAWEGIGLGDVLREGRPGVLLGWRANLLGVTAPSVAVEGSWPLPWLGAAWSAALRGGWWREAATVPAPSGFLAPIHATADVLPLAALLHRTFQAPWVRPYLGVGLGADLVVVRARGRGSLDASAALTLVAGGGRRLGPGEAFAEVGGGLGGVDGPLGRLRTGGISLSVGYRLAR